MTEAQCARCENPRGRLQAFGHAIESFKDFVRAQQSSQFFPQHTGDKTTHASMATPSKIATIVSEADVSWIAAGAEVVDVGVG